MVTDAVGRPARDSRGPAAGAGGAKLRPDDGRVRGQVWRPAVEARAYGPAAGPGYLDRNRLVGLMRVWAANKAQLSSPLFGDAGLAAAEAFAPAAAAVLAAGPGDADAWPDYLAANGRVDAGAPQPGDLLLFDDASRQAVMLDAGQMLAWSSDDGAVRLAPVADVKGRWIPPA